MTEKVKKDEKGEEPSQRRAKVKKRTQWIKIIYNVTTFSWIRESLSFCSALIYSSEFCILQGENQGTRESFHLLSYSLDFNKKSAFTFLVYMDCAFV